MEMKPVAIGLGLFLLAQTAYLGLVAVANTLPAMFIWLPYMAVLLSATVTGYMARSHHFMQFVVLGVLMAVIIGVSNFVWSEMGQPADLRGISGALLVGGFSLPFILVLSVAGGFLGAVWHDKART